MTTAYTLEWAADRPGDYGYCEHCRNMIHVDDYCEAEREDWVTGRVSECGGGVDSVIGDVVEVVVPVKFWDDHVARDLATGTLVLAANKRTVRVLATDWALKELDSDARYYADEMKGYDRGLAASAERTVVACENARAQ